MTAAPLSLLAHADRLQHGRTCDRDPKHKGEGGCCTCGLADFQERVARLEVEQALQVKQPISRVEWVQATSVGPNDYNPNRQAPPEARLLKISILEDGWTQPVVVFDDGAGGRPVIVDGEHRWRTGQDVEVAALTGGLVPIVRIRKDRAHLMMSTVRHNRARGAHSVKGMAALVRTLLEQGHSVDDVGFGMQMEREEVERLADSAGMPTKVAGGTKEFSKGWVPK